MGVMPPPTRLPTMPLMPSLRAMPATPSVATELSAARPQTNPSTQVMVPAGLHYSFGVMPLPQKLLTKILDLEFVDIQDLLPEAWLYSLEEETTGCCSSSSATRKRRPPVTNIFTWLQGFASLVSALSSKYPTSVPEFLAYQSTIIKCYRDYNGLGWV